MHRPRLRAAWVVLLAFLASAAGAAESPPPGGPAPPSPPPSPSAPSGAAAAPRWSDRLYYGGCLGASFGDVDYVSLTPMLGYSFNPKLSAGVSLFYVYRDDTRYEPDFTTSDYGFELFGRYRIVAPVFAELRYSHWSYEVLQLSGQTDRDAYDGFLLGGGFLEPMGGRSAFYFSVLYDFNYSTDGLSPYDDPWVVSAGISVGF